MSIERTSKIEFSLGRSDAAHPLAIARGSVTAQYKSVIGRGPTRPDQREALRRDAAELSCQELFAPRDATAVDGDATIPFSLCDAVDQQLPAGLHARRRNLLLCRCGGRDVRHERAAGERQSQQESQNNEAKFFHTFAPPEKFRSCCQLYLTGGEAKR